LAEFADVASLGASRRQRGPGENADGFGERQEQFAYLANGTLSRFVTITAEDHPAKAKEITPAFRKGRPR